MLLLASCPLLWNLLWEMGRHSGVLDASDLVFTVSCLSFRVGRGVIGKGVV